MTITDHLLEQLQTPAGGWTKHTITLLGIRWPLISGWQKRSLGMDIPDCNIAELNRIAHENIAIKTTTVTHNGFFGW